MDTGPSTCTTSHESLESHEGTSVLFVLAAPAVIAAIGALHATRRTLITVAALLSVFIVLGAMSIGVFFAPTTLAAWLAAGSASEVPLHRR